ncbi:MAG: porin [Thermodesulfobacteriota bacterium]
MIKKIITIGFLLPVLLQAQESSGGEHGGSEQPGSPPAFSSAWQAAHLYEDRENPSVHSFSLVGRYHGQYWITDSGEDQSEDWENRRFYIGFKAGIFENFILELQASVNDDFDPVYKGLYDAFVQWQETGGDLAISVGRLDYVYSGMERSTSSKKIKTMERSLLVNHLMPGEVIGLYVSGKKSDFSYQAGLFSGSIEDEFTDFEGGFGALAGLGYKLPLWYEKGKLRVEYLYNDGNEHNSAFKPYEHIVSLWHEGEVGPLAVGIDLTAAAGVDEVSDVAGLTILPSYTIGHNLLLGGDSLQLALRYHYASSCDDYGLSFNKRYERPVTSGKGDSYHSFYSGLNYYIYEQKLKLMAGVEYFSMDGVADPDEELQDQEQKSVDGWSFITGLRFYF